MLGLNEIDPEIRGILESALEGAELTEQNGRLLCKARGRELAAVLAAADELRRRQVGERVTYVVNRNINFTNVCTKRCSFCAFSRDARHQDAFFLTVEEIVGLAREAVELGATEVCIQAGLAPGLDGWYYVNLVRTLKRELPGLHLHAFSPEEVLHGATRARVSVREYLLALKEAGHDTIPGTSAEILDDEVRRTLGGGRIDSATWIEIVTTAHEIGLRTTATIMYGHVETDRHWMHHLGVLRAIQKRTGGFTELVPLSFVHKHTPLFRERRVPSLRRGPTGIEVLVIHAVARLFLGSSIPNIQCSWVKEGPKLAQALLLAGANDLGGTLINESISTSAGASHGQLLAPADMRRVIRDAGRIPAQRTSDYAILRTFETEAGSSALDDDCAAERLAQSRSVDDGSARRCEELGS